jgi:hypothetical protein
MIVAQVGVIYSIPLLVCGQELFPRGFETRCGEFVLIAGEVVKGRERP